GSATTSTYGCFGSGGSPPGSAIVTWWWPGARAGFPLASSVSPGWPGAANCAEPTGTSVGSDRSSADRTTSNCVRCPTAPARTSYSAVTPFESAVVAEIIAMSGRAEDGSRRSSRPSMPGLRDRSRCRRGSESMDENPSWDGRRDVKTPVGSGHLDGPIYLLIGRDDPRIQNNPQNRLGRPWRPRNVAPVGCLTPAGARTGSPDAVSPVGVRPRD